MLKTATLIVILALSSTCAEVSPSYSLLEKHAAFNPNIKTSPVESSGEPKDSVPDKEHPVYRAEENVGRARIAPVKPTGSIVAKHENMLSDQPAVSTEVNRVDNQMIPGYAYLPAAEVTYPDIPYAPGYGYDSSYAPSNHYDMYGGLANYYEPDTSTWGLLWSQVPDSRTMVSYVGRSVAWVFNSIFVLLLGSLFAVGVCSYTNLCTFTFHGMGPIHEEMRALMSPEKLEKISNAADFVKSAINKYQRIQKVADITNKNFDGARKRRNVFV